MYGQAEVYEKQKVILKMSCSSSLLFFLMSCNLKPHVVHWQFRGGDNCPPGWPGGGLGVSDWRTLAVQMHGDGWRKTSLSTGIHLSSPLFWPSYWWQGDRCPLPTLVSPSFAANDWPLSPPISVSISAKFWPLLPLALMGFLDDPLPTPAPANVLFGGECGHCRITLRRSPCGTLLQEVLILGAILDDADRDVSAVAEDTVTVGILPSTTTRDEQDRDPTTNGHSSLLSPGKVDRPVMPGLVGVENDAPSGWEGREYILKISSFKGCPVMGSKLYSMGVPTAG